MDDHSIPSILFLSCSFVVQRIHGEKVAEVPLVATRFQYRRQGMCRVLINLLEKVMYGVFLQFVSTLGSDTYLHP